MLKFQLRKGLTRFDQAGQSYFYLVDGLGSVMKITNSSGVVIQSYTYDSFGNIVQQTPNPPAINQPFTYTGREWDAAAGLYYYRARYYDPAIGRFISEDPLTFDSGGGDTNPYIYVLNNPLKYKDPLGLFNVTGNCCESRQEAQQAGDDACRNIDPTITDAKLRECLKKRCKSGTIKCDTKVRGNEMAHNPQAGFGPFTFRT